ncbi:MAG: fibronectin type III domain-containing protein, partial [Nitrospirae bacterium]|nr:fibronectin type III domain-containing protein [Nitrospirota bacterium]
QWDSGYSNASTATTSTIAAPGSFAASAVTDTRTDLSWADNTTDETGFKIERCEGEGCSNYVEITTAAANATTYSNTGLTPSVNYCYRVRAYKTATCGWNTVYSNESCDQTYSASPTALTATPVNSMVIQLNWTDNAADEDGYELEVQIFNGKFVRIATLAADAASFTDTMSIEPEKQYKYRVRAYRGADNSPYSNEATATTPAYLTGDSTCY